jgi:hypothetical protein
MIEMILFLQNTLGKRPCDVCSRALVTGHPARVALLAHSERR